jgi:hypothetical protein
MANVCSTYVYSVCKLKVPPWSNLPHFFVEVRNVEQ